MTTIASKLLRHIMLLQTALLASGTWAAPPEVALPHALQRASLANCINRFKTKNKAHVAFLGGSITENAAGHSAMIPAWLKQRFPGTKFAFTNAGLSSTCSTTGAFRLKRDVLSQGPADLLVVEFAVNDDQDAAHSRENALRGMEGIIRQVRRHNPNADIIVIHYVNPGMLAKIQAGETPVSVDAHEAAAIHYRLPSVNVGGALAALIETGEMDWQSYGGTHPKAPGYRLVSDLVISLLERALDEPGQTVQHPLPEPLDPDCYGPGAVLVDPDKAAWMGGWTSGPASEQLLPKGAIRDRYRSQQITVASEPGALLTLPFEGKAVGAFVLAGPDAGVIETSLDGKPFVPHDLYHRHSKALNYPRTIMFYQGQKPGRHQLTLRIADVRHPKSSGNRAAILWFATGQ